MQALRQLNSPGKSGCLFFLSDDQKFLVKTMRKSEIHTLIAMLPGYYKHMETNGDSLVPRFFGVYGIKQVRGWGWVLGSACFDGGRDFAE